MVPMQPHSGGLTPAHVPNVPPGWAPGGGAQGVIAQRMTPQMPPVLPNASQVPPHTQTPPAMVPGFTAGPRAPPGGPSGAAGDGAAAPRQVTGHLDRKLLISKVSLQQHPLKLDFRPPVLFLYVCLLFHHGGSVLTAQEFQCFIIPTVFMVDCQRVTSYVRKKQESHNYQ